jgi:rSAM/selenodomain-associated transferase 1
MMTTLPSFQQCAIAIMAKAPRHGHVKTRLTPTLPAEQVVRLYTCLLTDTIRLASSLEGVRVVLLCPAEDVETLSSFGSHGVEVLPQEGKGLAAGLVSVFRLMLGPGCRRVIALDSDSPHLPPTVLSEAFAHLETHDLVIGPTVDGGYYLVGASAAHPGLFDAPRMGTNAALDDLRRRARDTGLAVAHTLEWYDVDEADDLARLASDLGADPWRAPVTAAFLRDLGTGAQRRQGGL